MLDKEQQVKQKLQSLADKYVGKRAKPAWRAVFDMGDGENIHYKRAHAGLEMMAEHGIIRIWDGVECRMVSTDV